MLLSKNRKALFNYEIVEKYMAGVVLHGYEVKAIREGNVNFEGSYIKIDKNEVFLINLYIGKYSKQSKNKAETDPKRPRKLILNRREIYEIEKEISQKGKSAVPLALLLKNNMIKLEMAVVKGKKEFEKKQTAKEKQIQKDLAKEVKNYGRSL